MLLLPNFSGGGAERVSINLVNSLGNSGLGLTPCLVVLNHSGPYKHLLSPTVKVEVLGKERLLYSIPDIIKTVYRYKPSVLISSFGYINIVLLALRLFLPRNTKLWVREANLPSISLANNKYPNLMRLAYASFYRFADLVICSSGRMLNEFQDQFGVPGNKLRVLPNPVDEVAIRDSITEFPPITSGKCFVAAGRLTKQKGFDRLISMFAQLGESNSELIILGEGSLEESLKRQVVELGLGSRIRFVGFCDNPWRWYGAADAFLLPSRWEGMPNAALEALACGCPVIATPESGGIAEVASAALPGAVLVAEAGAPFIAAMRDVPCRLKDRVYPSLLPAHYRLDAVANTFMSWMIEHD